MGLWDPKGIGHGARSAGRVEVIVSHDFGTLNGFGDLVEGGAGGLTMSRPRISVC